MIDPSQAAAEQALGASTHSGVDAQPAAVAADSAGNAARRYDVVVFDFDGTLADSTALYELLLPALAQQRGVPEPEQGWQSLRSLGTTQMLRALKIRWWQLPAVTGQMRAMMAAHLHRVQLFAGMQAVLEQLHAQGVQLILLTSNSESTVHQVLGPALPLFSALYCRAPLLGKQRLLRRALARSGAPRTRILSVGDEDRDGRASQACGIDFVGVSWGLASPQVLQPYSAFALLAQPQDLLRCVLEARPPG